MTMRLPVLASAFLLLAMTAPAAIGLAAEVALDAPDASAVALPPEARPAQDALAGVPPVALPPVDVDASLEVDTGLVGKASVGASSGQPEGPGHEVVEALAVAAPPAIAAVGLLAILQAFGAFRALAVGGVALYSRLAKSDLLDNEHRDKVYRLVQESPGIGLTEITQRAGLGWGTTVYHLDRLERAQMVTSERVGAHRCYFPMGAVPRAARKGIGALKADTTRSVAAFLATRPGASQTDLCEGLGLSASAASKQVTKLESAGLVRRERDGKTVRLWPAETLHPLLGDAPAAAPALPLVAGGRAAALA